MLFLVFCDPKSSRYISICPFLIISLQTFTCQDPSEQALPFPIAWIKKEGGRYKYLKDIIVQNVEEQKGGESEDKDDINDDNDNDNDNDNNNDNDGEDED